MNGNDLVRTISGIYIGVFVFAGLVALAHSQSSAWHRRIIEIDALRLDRRRNEGCIPLTLRTTPLTKTERMCLIACYFPTGTLVVLVLLAASAIKFPFTFVIRCISRRLTDHTKTNTKKP